MPGFKKRPRVIRTPVTVHDRRFTVVSNKAGVVLRIDERKTDAIGRPWECKYNICYWHANHGTAKRGTLPRMVIDAAKERYAAS